MSRSKELLEPIWKVFLERNNGKNGVRPFLVVRAVTAAINFLIMDYEHYNRLHTFNP